MENSKVGGWGRHGKFFHYLFLFIYFLNMSLKHIKLPKNHFKNKLIFFKERCLSQFPAIFMADKIGSDWPDSQHNKSSHPAVGCLANQKQYFPP